MYVEGYVLKEDEFLLKLWDKADSGLLHESYYKDEPVFGFLTKLTKKNELPKSFVDWGRRDIPMYVHEEYYRSGWKLHK